MRIATIGSREVSPKTAQILELVGHEIARRGWFVVTGNADGADSKFAAGANKVNPTQVKLFLPWSSYNKNYLKPGNLVEPNPKKEWEELARKNHPIYDNLTQGAQKLMLRNAGIILDCDCVLAVLNHKKKGMGGTGAGWRMSEELGKPRLDLAMVEIGSPTFDEIFKWLEKQKDLLTENKN